MEEGVKKKNSYWWIIILVILIGVWLYVRNQPDEDMTFVVGSGQEWYSCWNSTSNISVSYEISASSALDLLFTPSKKDADGLNETHYDYPSCSSPGVLTDKGSCVISGEGCMVLLNKNINDATVSLKYSAKETN